MKTIASVIQVILVLGFVIAPHPAKGAAVNPDFTKQVSDILSECGKIVPGSTRTDLLKVFTTEGGLSQPMRRTFVHRQCPYIKVDVEFTPSSPSQSRQKEEPTDVIVKISKPYLEFSHMD